jgi:8-oxo-dGTP diphosphatase
MARVPVMAAGGIVMRREQPPLVAVVRLRKRDEWVLPKGKLDEGETARAAARREVLEETGHNVTVHEFLGTLVYESGGRSKVVHYWRMEAGSTQVRELMHDIRAVDWLPLDEALVRLSRSYERAFLENVGPLAVGVLMRRLRAKTAVAKAPPANKAPVASKAPPAFKAPPAVKAPAPKKRRVKLPTVTPQLPLSEIVPAPVDFAEPALQPAAGEEIIAEGAPDFAAIEAEAPMLDEEFIPQPDRSEGEVEEEAQASDLSATETAEALDAAEVSDVTEDGGSDTEPSEPERRSLAQKVRNWLGRAA